MFSWLVCLIVCLTLCHSLNASVMPPTASALVPLKRSFNLRDELVDLKLKSKNLLGELPQMPKRLPSSIFALFKEGSRNYIQTAIVLIPVGLIFNINSIKDVKLWLKKGSGVALEWAKISAYFAAGEAFFTTIRDNKHDRYNSYLSSGVTSALLKLPHGPYAMAQSFAVGFGFMYALDKFMGHPEHGPSHDALHLVNHDWPKKGDPIDHHH